MEKQPKKKSFREKLTKKLKQKIYKWHKILAFITIIPVLFWCLSGLMHPFMAHFFKPEIARDILEAKSIDPSGIKISLKEALLQNNIQEIKNFRFVSFEGHQYYQVKTIEDNLVYLNTIDGKLLKNGDGLYAACLARYFLDDAKTPIANQQFITEFNNQYKYVNRYLPVHKISFDRPDQMQVYVETATGKLATFNPKSRQWFIWFFDTFHNWSFIDAIGNNAVRICLMVFLLVIIGFSALSGILIYGLFWKQFKKAKTSDASSKRRKYHRQAGLMLALFTLTFAFSGAYHATKKWNPIPVEKMVYEPVFKVQDLDASGMKGFLALKHFKNMTLIQFKDSLFYRCQFAGEEQDEVRYFNSVSQKENKTADTEYAQFLASYFNGKISGKDKNCCEMDGVAETVSNKKEHIKETASITDFKNHDYGFVNKRLPVVKVAFESENNKTAFVETGTSHLAAFITDSDRAEGYSFAFFHKFLFMEWAGKDIRDLTMVLAALGVLTVGILGLSLLLKRR
ncbi:PepSY-associated TM helix domain-containing protein [Flavobacterium humi]|uniref:PepSY domain-containing protein n=1 Tax=Flavobacterium humi TaxID=2562683 RepID=A0A4Z0L5A2_9FLAO|nr:PepSY-associated TM helix domain-containing protein [Flavobacterium humi]TGD56888.1 PepSY domain-containing protein [Flavobacterium humi]